MNGGVQQKMLDSVNLISDLGSKKDLQNMIDSAEEKGIAVYLNGITNYAMDSGITDGFFVCGQFQRTGHRNTKYLFDFIYRSDNF